MDAFPNGANIAIVGSRHGLTFQRLTERLSCCPLFKVRTKIMTQFLKLMERNQLYDVESINKNGDTALHLAVKNDKFTQEECIAVLNILIDWGINRNTKNREHSTILCLAIMHRMKEVVDFLLSCKCELGDLAMEHLLVDEYEKFEKQCNKVSDSKLLKFERDSSSFFEWLMTKGIKLRSPDHNRPIKKAISLDLLHILPVILKYSNCIKCRNKLNVGLLHWIFHENFVRRNGKHRRDWYSPYAKRHSLTIVKILLDQGISPDTTNQFGETAICMAIDKRENIDIIEMLIEHSINIDIKNLQEESAFYVAIKKWILSPQEPETHYYSKILKALISNSANVNTTDKYGKSPLCFAVENNNLKAVKFLQKNGADFSVITNLGKNLLHLLAMFTMSTVENEDDSSEQLFNLLISNGCQVGAEDVSGNTPLHDAAAHGNLSVARKIIKYGVKVDCETKDALTPLHKAMLHGHTDLVQFLLDNGANFYATTIYGETLMHLLVNDLSIYNNLTMLQYLLKLGANFNAQTKMGYSVLLIALWRDYNKHVNSYEKVNIDQLPSLASCIQEHISEAVDFLLNHWIKLEVVGLKCNTGFEYTDLVMIEKYKNIEIECHKEMEKLKKTFIDCSTSLYDWLLMNFNKKRGYINNEKLQQFVQSLELEKKFPEYWIIILANYREAATRKSLLNLANVVWLKLTEIRLPDICLDIIFSYMNSAELFNFTNVREIV